MTIGLRSPAAFSAVHCRFREAKIGLQLLQFRVTAIPVGELRRLGADWPLDCKRRIVEGDPKIVGGAVVVGRLVDHLGFGLQYAKSMSEADRDP
jgi:hypothetical protein